MTKVLEDITNEENIGNFPKHVWLEFVSNELKDKLFKLKSDNGMVPLETVDEIVQLFVNDIEKIGNALEKRIEKEGEARRKAEQNALERNFGKDGKQEARVYDKFFLHDTYITKEEYLKHKDNYILY